MPTFTPHEHAVRLLVFLGLVSLFTAKVYAESLDDLAAIVSVEQTRSFSDVERLETTLNTAPPVTVTLPWGSSPSQLIKRVYGFGASDSKQAYDLVESRILQLNGASHPTRLLSGKVVVPDLPALASQSPESMTTTGPVVSNRSPIVEMAARPTSDVPRLAYSKPIKIASPIGKSLTYTRIDRYPAAEAARIIAESTDKKIGVVAGIEAGIQLAANPADCSAPSAMVLSTDERNAIAKALSGPVDQTERYLFVLDTGWPSLDDQFRSQQIMRRILDSVKAALRLPPSALSRFDPAIQSADFVPTSHVHACMIASALHEFTELDMAGRIKVVFLPLRPGQVKARELFREIIELDQLIVALGGELFARSPSAAQEIPLAKEFAEQALARLPSLKEPWASGDDVVRIYEPLISGLIRILDTYARITPVAAPGMVKVDARFWLSFSWNFTKFAATPALPSSTNYMVFAATGNDGQDFVVGHRLFASEAAIGWRVFAVMNNDQEHGTLTCKSALYAALWDESTDTNIGSFPGRLGTMVSQPCPGTGGGTSFSTPRLAWLAAVSDVASRSKDLNWPKTLSLRLLKSREKVAGDPYAAPIRVLKLFASQ